MVAIKARDTRPELEVRRRLHRQGYRYLVDARPEHDIRRRADLVFRRARVAVFIDGCFWHACPDHYKPPATNPEYWSAKVRGNLARDRETNQLLEARGWTIARYWEHEDADAIATDIARLLHRRNLTSEAL